MIILKTENCLDDDIIKEKGNTRCIFYLDNECRKGDKTRDCINCARVEYRALYSLNWHNQTRLEKQIDILKKENKKLRNKIKEYDRNEV